MSTVGQLYDDLFHFEQKSKRSGSYPIHKSLTFAEPGVSNIYQWLLHHEDFSNTSKILDCGCGAGYGAVTLAAALNAEVHGISISQKEVDQAQAYAREQGQSDRCHFQLRSFDDISENYDCIIAIESLKHSPNLEHTLGVLSKRLNPNGKLIIFEDFYTGKNSTFAGSRLKADWILQELHTQNDYQAAGLQEHKVQDFTSVMKSSGGLLTLLKIGLAEAGVGLGKLGLWKYASTKIFRGAFYLDWLYVNNAMRYQMIQLVKK